MSGNTSRIAASTVLVLSVIASAFLMPAVEASAGRHNLRYTDVAEEGAPPEVSLGIAMGAFRGIFVNYLWMRANEMKQDGLFYESVDLARVITKLQPRFPEVWGFHAWNLAYNLSVETSTPQERWHWVDSAIRLLKDEGIPANPNSLLLYKELAYIYLHKIGGFTDDSNRYYKAVLAERWHEILGEPPRIGPEDRNARAASELYAEWLRPIVDAPDTRIGLAERSPEAFELLEELESIVSFDSYAELLERYQLASEVQDSIYFRLVELGPRSEALFALIDDTERAEAWADLLAFMRRRVIIDEHAMSPLFMMRITERIGPIDWRAPAAHTLYWSMRGTENATTRATEENAKLYDFVNTDRLTVQGVQELFRYGDISFNYVDHKLAGAGFYQALINPYFDEAYATFEQEVQERGGIFEHNNRARSTYIAGLENFMRDVAVYYFRRGNIERAEYWQTQFRTLDRQNLNQWDREFESAMPIEDFVQRNTFKRGDTPNVAVQQVVGSLQGAFQSMLDLDPDAYLAQLRFAQDAHTFFVDKQIRDVTAQGSAARMEVMDRDFRYVAGTVFADYLQQLPLAEAEQLYTLAGTEGELRKYVYDYCVTVFGEPVAQLEDRGGPSIEELFPEPDNMPEFRQRMQAKLQQARDRGPDAQRQK